MAELTDIAQAILMQADIHERPKSFLVGNHLEEDQTGK